MDTNTKSQNKQRQDVGVGKFIDSIPKMYNERGQLKIILEGNYKLYQITKICIK